jgi:sn-glycerol 3-phosphate transport system ATP-binding protein/multiple sugar transport system ATP-binding protein
MNFIDARLEEAEGGAWRATASGGLSVPIDAAGFGGALASGQEVSIGVRPHDVELVSDAAEGAPLDVSIVEALGAESYAHGSLGGASFIARVEAASGVKKGEKVNVALKNVHLFDKKSGASLRAGA